MFKKTFWIFGVVFFILLLFLPGYTKIQELRDRNKDLEQKMKRLNIENALLEQELLKMKNDPVYQEQLAREKMGVVRKGEVPVKILPAKRN